MILHELSRRWNFVPDYELPPGYCSRVWVGGDRVLKIPFQGEEQTSGRIAALQLQGVGGPEIFESDLATGALLMARADPGTPCRLSDLELLPRWADLVEAQQSLATDGLLPVAEYAPGGPAYAGQVVFLHGDLHHDNLLAHGAGWMVIDPKGLVGDPCFAASALLTNPVHEIADVASWRDRTLRRVDFLERRFGWSPARILDWAIADRGSPESDAGEPWKIAAEALHLARHA